MKVTKQRPDSRPEEVSQIVSFNRLISRVRRRGLGQAILDSLTSGLLLAEVGAILFLLVGIFSDRFHFTLIGYSALTILIGLVAGIVSGLFTPYAPKDSARAIDRAYALEDRFLTTLGILRRSAPTELTDLERLQVSDSLGRIDQINPREVVPFRIPRSIAYAIVPFVLLIGLFVLLNPESSSATPKTPNETVVDVLQELRTEIHDPLREMIREDPENRALKELDFHVGELMEKLEESSDDPKKGLAVLSEMDQEIQKTIESFQIEATDRSFQDIAHALENSDATRSVAKALSEGDYETAAEEFEKIDFDAMSAQERETLSQRLKNAAETIRQRKQDQLAQLTEQLAEELQDAKCASCKNTACQFAGKCKSQERNKALAKKLSCQRARLGLCKAECAGACASCESNCAGKEQASQEGGNVQKGSSSSSGPLAGTDSAENPLTGNDTPTETTGKQQRLNGKQGGDGPSEVEVYRSGEKTDEKVRTPYNDAYHSYQKERESVLDDEEIPLEQRDVLRNYFEAIRPSESGERVGTGEEDDESHHLNPSP